MSVGIVYDVDGLEQVEHDLLGMAARAVETRPLLEAFATVLEAQMAERFASEGDGDWEPLAASTIARKGSSVIGRETDAMMDSLTDSGAEGSTREIFGDELIFGTHLANDDGFPYPTVFDQGREGKQPARPIFDLGQLELREFTRAVQGWLMGAERSEFGAGSWGMAATIPFGV